MKRALLGAIAITLVSAAIAIPRSAIADDTASTPAPTYALDPHGGSWLHGPNLPAPRQDSAVAVLDGHIYVIGGFGPGGSPTSSNFVLEQPAGTNLTPSAAAAPAPVFPVGSWTTARSMPEAIDHAAAAALDGYIYVAGGSVEKLVSNKFWRYDPVDDSWATMPPLPVPRYAATMQAFDGKLYLIGGASSHAQDERSIEVFDPATSSWTLIDYALGSEREQAETALFDGKIVLVGGRDRDEHNIASCDLYDPAHNVWSVCSSMHLARSDFGLAAVENRLSRSAAAICSPASRRRRPRSPDKTATGGWTGTGCRFRAKGCRSRCSATSSGSSAVRVPSRRRRRRTSCATSSRSSR
ncbi:MAG TPA: kelch repeat-containing protein [Candidatus Eremiobacteraceae bacterium]|nr:kelch repeat-containing protein [Candidatus Eremiobacteraceae bacterium]